MTDPESELEKIIAEYETSLNLSNAQDIENQLSKPLENENTQQKAEREAYLQIVQMCENLNFWAGKGQQRADSDDHEQSNFLRRQQISLNNISQRIDSNGDLAQFKYLVDYAKGFVFRGLGQHAAAFEAFKSSAQESTKFKKRFFRADAQMAAQKIYLDDLPEARRLIEIAISNTPEHSKPALANEKWTAGRIEFFSGNDHAAVNLLHESIDLNPDLWYSTAYLCSAYSYLGLNKPAEQLLKVLQTKFHINTLNDVIEREKRNPTDNSKSVKAGRIRLHGGLIKAGLPHI